VRRIVSPTAGSRLAESFVREAGGVLAQDVLWSCFAELEVDGERGAAGVRLVCS
jgi:hypothetical protein